MVETVSKAIELQNRRVQEHLQQATARMDEWTAQQVRELRMTQPGRQAAERAFRKVSCMDAQVSDTAAPHAN